MSADQHEMCPRCHREMVQKENDYWEKLEDDYGKIPMGEYLSRQKNPPSFELNETLRVYRQIYIEAYRLAFVVYYNATCDVCKWSFQYEFEKEIEI